MTNKKLSPQQLEKWLVTMKNELMSSEESEVDENGDDVVVVRPLPWRSSYCSRMFSKIDSYTYHKKSSQGKRQMKNRRVGEPSSRVLPTDINVPDWVVNTQPAEVDTD